MRLIKIDTDEYINVDSIQGIQLVTEDLYGKRIRTYVVLRLPWEVKVLYENEHKIEVVKRLNKLIKEIDSEKK